MSAVPNRDTKPEVMLRTALWKRGLRYRLRMRVPGKPDITFPGPMVAVFVDGDFWHGNAWRVRGLASFDAQFRDMNNSEFWQAKIEKNMDRDVEVSRILGELGWAVYRVYESRLNSQLEEVAAEIEYLVRSRRDEKGISRPQEKERTSRA